MSAKIFIKKSVPLTHNKTVKNFLWKNNIYAFRSFVFSVRFTALGIVLLDSWWVVYLHPRDAVSYVKETDSSSHGYIAGFRFYFVS